MRGKRFDERAGEMRDHACSASRRTWIREAIRALLTVLLLAGRIEAGEWFLLPEPKFMGRDVSFPIDGAKSTVLAPVKIGGEGIEFAKRGGWHAAGLNEEAVRKITGHFASEWLRHVNVEMVRNRKKVVEYAVVRSENVPACVTVFAPEFLKRFEDVFGPKMKVVIPNRHTVFVFPGVAVDFADHASVVLEAWRSRSPKVSLEVFELSNGPLRAVGRFEEP